MTDEATQAKIRLEELRIELRDERISYGELVEMQSLSDHIDPSDVELLEAAGVAEEDEDACDKCGASTSDGEGYDGYCGDCADKLEAKGYWG